MSLKVMSRKGRRAVIRILIVTAPLCDACGIIYVADVAGLGLAAFRGIPLRLMARILTRGLYKIKSLHLQIP